MESNLELRKLSTCVIANNTFYRGYMEEMVADLGEHGADFVFVNNVGSPMK